MFSSAGRSLIRPKIAEPKLSGKRFSAFGRSPAHRKVQNFYWHFIWRPTKTQRNSSRDPVSGLYIRLVYQAHKPSAGHTVQKGAEHSGQRTAHTMWAHPDAQCSQCPANEWPATPGRQALPCCQKLLHTKSAATENRI